MTGSTPSNTHMNGNLHRAPNGGRAGSVTPVALPPGTDAATFNEYAKRAVAIVGEENVTIVIDAAEVHKHDYFNPSKASDMFNMCDDTHFLCSAVVAPRGVEDTQALLKLANEFSIPVWPFSIGRNLGYGGAAPRVRGSVGLDMGRHLNKIIKVDVENAYAIVEPGVTYFELHQYLVDNNLRDRVWLDTPGLGGGSVLGNAIERGVGYTPYGDHWMMHCGMEVILPNGELLRTGMGALPNPKADTTKPLHEQEPNECWQLFNYGFGPYNDGIFSQASLGVCVKMGMWLMTNPGGYQSYIITFPKDSDVDKTVEIIRPLRVGGILQNVPTLRHILLDAAVMGSKKDYFPDKPVDQPLTDDELDQLATKHGLGRWNFYGAVYGAPPIAEAMLTAIKAAFSKIPGSKFFLPEDMPNNEVAQTRHNTLQGIPSTDELAWVDWLPNGAHVAFSPIAPVTGKDAAAQYATTRRLVEKYGFDFIGTYIIGMREMHHIVEVVFDRADPDSRRRAHLCVKEMIVEAANHGWGEYRTHLAIMDDVVSTYNFNNHVNLRLNEQIKDALDPKGILAPGKNGIWPRSYRADMARWKVPSPN
ncbi:FAD-linked oxidase [Lecanosticta acicola]|uniref:FAD-linked oxidase n=1 Tax=Lecanosticta acicola TaxID=111012 RepID=A0AAI8Z2Q8_9PEZI|nr:FAD-linked oxidase [Lecanosticta acicola]